VDGSEAVNSNVAVVELVVSVGPDVIVVSGGVVSVGPLSTKRRNTRFAPA
jgi:hypothetical protein